jgi:hypothetical protein
MTPTENFAIGVMLLGLGVYLFAVGYLTLMP